MSPINRLEIQRPGDQERTQGWIQPLLPELPALWKNYCWNVSGNGAALLTKPINNYLVATNFFRPLQGGSKAVSIASSFTYLRRRRAGHAHPAPPPALITRSRATVDRSGLCPGDPSAAAMGGHVSVTGAGRGRRAELHPAVSHPDGPRAGAGGHPGVVSSGITQP